MNPLEIIPIISHLVYVVSFAASKHNIYSDGDLLKNYICNLSRVNKMFNKIMTNNLQLLCNRIWFDKPFIHKSFEVKRFRAYVPPTIYDFTNHNIKYFCLINAGDKQIMLPKCVKSIISHDSAFDQYDNVKKLCISSMKSIITIPRSVKVLDIKNSTIANPELFEGIYDLSLSNIKQRIVIPKSTQKLLVADVEITVPTSLNNLKTIELYRNNQNITIPLSAENIVLSESKVSNPDLSERENIKFINLVGISQKITLPAEISIWFNEGNVEYYNKYFKHGRHIYISAEKIEIIPHTLYTARLFLANVIDIFIPNHIYISNMMVDDTSANTIVIHINRDTHFPRI